MNHYPNISADNTTIRYRYDASGNRVEKSVEKEGETSLTRYVRDASGNVMAVYKGEAQAEWHLYGSSRLGMGRGKAQSGQLKLGLRSYELSNHLGNVLAVITDNVNMTPDAANSRWYDSKAWTTVLNTSDYYPFGLEMEGRTTTVDGEYRYGFNAKEKDTDFANHYDYGFRIYNPKIAKFLSVDPLAPEFPWNSTYAFAENDVIRSIDLEGLEKFVTIFSPMQTQSIKSAIENKNWKEVERITNYALANGFVGKDGKLNDYMYNKLDSKDSKLLGRNQRTAFLKPLGDKQVYYFFGIEVDDNFNPIGFEYLGKVDYNKINYEKWLIRLVENPESTAEKFHEISTRYILGKNIYPPSDNAEKIDYKWPNGFGNFTYDMNRSDQVSDLASWREFAEDFEKDPDKYLNVAREFMVKFFGEKFNNELRESNQNNNER